MPGLDTFCIDVQLAGPIPVPRPLLKTRGDAVLCWPGSFVNFVRLNFLCGQIFEL